jgi:hypothetical protein
MPFVICTVTWSSFRFIESNAKIQPGNGQQLQNGFVSWLFIKTPIPYGDMGFRKRACGEIAPSCCIIHAIDIFIDDCTLYTLLTPISDTIRRTSKSGRRPPGQIGPEFRSRAPTGFIRSGLKQQKLPIPRTRRKSARRPHDAVRFLGRERSRFRAES